MPSWSQNVCVCFLLFSSLVPLSLLRETHQVFCFVLFWGTNVSLSEISYWGQAKVAVPQKFNVVHHEFIGVNLQECGWLKGSCRIQKPTPAWVSAHERSIPAAPWRIGRQLDRLNETSLLRAVHTAYVTIERGLENLVDFKSFLRVWDLFTFWISSNFHLPSERECYSQDCNVLFNDSQLTGTVQEDKTLTPTLGSLSYPFETNAEGGSPDFSACLCHLLSTCIHLGSHAQASMVGMSGLDAQVSPRVFR